jgi:hypothetical protein
MQPTSLTTVRLHRLISALQAIEQELESLRSALDSSPSSNDLVRYLSTELLAHLDCAAMDFLPELKDSLVAAVRVSLSRDHRLERLDRVEGEPADSF